MFKVILLNLLKGLNRRVSRTNWRDLRSLKPVSNIFGYDRGDKSIYRYYVDKFVQTNANKIFGKVLEVGSPDYISKNLTNIINYEIINYTPIDTPHSFVGDLTKTDTIPQSKFDCFICTQTLNFIYDFKSAVEGMHYLLKKNGHLIVTVSGMQQISKYDQVRWGDYWRFTEEACKKMFGDVFGKDNVKIEIFGNVLASVAAMEGISANELTTEELDYVDNSYQIIIGIVAKK